MPAPRTDSSKLKLFLHHWKKGKLFFEMHFIVEWFLRWFTRVKCIANFNVRWIVSHEREPEKKKGEKSLALESVVPFIHICTSVFFFLQSIASLYPMVVKISIRILVSRLPSHGWCVEMMLWWHLTIGFGCYGVRTWKARLSLISCTTCMESPSSLE